MYSITTIPRHNRVAISFSGWMEQDHPTLFKEIMNAANAMQSRTGEWDLMADFTDTPVMTQERAQNTTKIFGWCLANGMRRTAVVLISATQQMQLQRVTARAKTVRYFDNAEAARDWLAN
jgi:hypothetical protein